MPCAATTVIPELATCAGSAPTAGGDAGDAESTAGRGRRAQLQNVDVRAAIRSRSYGARSSVGALEFGSRAIIAGTPVYPVRMLEEDAVPLAPPDSIQRPQYSQSFNVRWLQGKGGR